ncbi:MAG: tetratricopeptide repeat protein [Planctomycetota bacterium]|nr:tetratricopeptide repeat protein [Planctomycetota bacterium]MDA1159648.1 tetratricopeptide repeat protein [Planctomycetota bacterium]
MSSRIVTGLLLTLCLSPCFAVNLSVANAQEASSPSDLYAEAVIAYFAKDYNTADSGMTRLIEDGTGDPRTYYFRGLSRYASGNLDAADIDFEAGARLEHSGLVGVNVPRSLERIQGPVRRVLEDFRRLAQRNSALQGRPHKKDRAILQLTADGTEAFLTGKHKVAVQLLDVAVSNGSNDPRTYYFRGLAKQELGLTDEAATDYKTAIGLELHPANRIDVDLALEPVQGETRLALEKHRHEAISTARQASDKERQAMIASLIEQRAADAAAGTGGAAIAKSAITLPPGAASPMPTATTPAATSPGTTASTQPATPSSAQPAANANALNVAWLPADSEVVINVRVRELSLSPMLAPLLAAPESQANLQMMKDEFGLTPGDVDSVTIGLRGATELAMTGAANPAALASGKDNAVVVVRTRLPFDPQIVEKRTDDFEAATHDGKPFYRSLKPGNIPCVYLPDSKTIVLAEEEPLTSSIEQGSETASRPEFDFVDASSHLAIAFVPNDPFSLTEPIPTEGSGSDALDRLSTAVKDQLLGVGLEISLSDSLELEVRALCVDDAAATEVDASIGDLMNEAKGLWTLAKAGAPAPIVGIVDSIIRAQKNSADAQVASLSTRLTAQSIERAVEGAKEMLPMLMMGAMAGLGGAMGPGDLSIGSNSGEPIKPPAATKPAAGLSVAATAKLSSRIDLDDEGNEKPKAIELLLAITGDQAQAAGGAGFASVSSAKDNNGTDLTLRVVSNFGAGGFEAIDRDDFFVKHPDNGCTAIVTFDPPAEAATAIASAEGIVKLRIVENSSQIIVDGAKSLLGKEVDNSELVAAGYKLKLEEKKEKFGDDEFTLWQLEWLNAGSAVDVQQIADGGGLGLQTPQLVDADGNVIAEFSGTSYVSFGNNSSLSWSMSIQDDQPVPDDARLRFTLNTDVSIVDVPFKVENVAISKDDNGF